MLSFAAGEFEDFAVAKENWMPAFAGVTDETNCHHHSRATLRRLVSQGRNPQHRQTSVSQSDPLLVFSIS